MIFNPQSQSFSIIPMPLPEQDYKGTGRCFTARATAVIDTIIIHSCYVPEGVLNPETAAGLIESSEIDSFRAMHDTIAQSGVAALEPFSVRGVWEIFRYYGVSAHFVVDRAGAIFEFVPPGLLAFHAGASRMPHPDDQREKVNQFSIGIELLGTLTSGFTDVQYSSLASLVRKLKIDFPGISNYFGHADIAPGRKTDPDCFDWRRFSSAIGFDPSKEKIATGASA